MANVLVIKGYTSEQIKSEFQKDDRYKIGMKLNAIYQLSKGMSSRKLVDFYGTSFKQILNWVHRFEAEGVEGLKDKEGRGRKPKLSGEQIEALKEIISSKSPIDFGYNTNTWTGAILIELISKEFKTIYKKTQVYNLLKQMGFTYQKAKGKYPEADIEKQEKFKEDLKKTT
jgi:transposase